jgi:hypothetical protein
LTKDKFLGYSFTKGPLYNLTTTYLLLEATEDKNLLRLHIIVKNHTCQPPELENQDEKKLKLKAEEKPLFCFTLKPQETVTK